MTQRSLFRHFADLIRRLYRRLDAAPVPPVFDTYGPALRAPASFTQRLFLR